MLLNDLRHAAIDALREKHKLPSLLLFYSFIDICASLADETSTKINRDRFENYLRRYALLSWQAFTPYELWAARSSLLHAYSPLGDHTSKPNGARAIFYFAWPEKKEEMHEAIVSRGYANFYLMDVNTIKHTAVSSFNNLWMRVEQEAPFELIFRANAEHLLKDLRHIQIENELTVIQELNQLNTQQSIITGLDDDNSR